MSKTLIVEAIVKLELFWETVAIEVVERLASRAVDAFFELAGAANTAGTEIREVADPADILQKLEVAVNGLSETFGETQTVAKKLTQSLSDIAASSSNAGAKIDSSVGTLTDSFGAAQVAAKKLTHGFDELTPNAAEAGGEIQDAGHDAKKSKSDLDELAGSVIDLGAKLGGLIFSSGAGTWLKDLASGSELAARRLGITTEQVALLRNVARASGAELDDVQGVLVTFGDKMRSAVLDPKSDSAKELRRLGIAIPASTSEIPGSMALLDTLADSLAGIHNPAERAAAASALLGDEGVKLLPSLEQGSGGIEEMRQRLEKLGGGFTNTGGISEFTGALNDLKTVMESLASRVVAKISEAFDGLGIDLADVSEVFFELVDNSRILEAAIATLTTVAVLFGTAAAAAWLAASWPIALLVAGIAAVILIVDDLMVAFEGGKSLIGEFIDSMFGAGTATQVFDSIRNAWNVLTHAFVTKITYIRNVFSDLINLWRGGPSVIGEMIDSIFGIDAASHFVDNLKAAFDRVWAVLSTIGGFVVDTLQPVFEMVFGAAKADFESSVASDEKFNRRFEEMNRGSGSIQSPAISGAQSSSMIQQDSTLNLNVTSAPSHQQLADIIRQEMVNELDRRDHGLTDAMQEVAV